MTFKGGLGDFMKQIISKQCKNQTTCKILLQVNSVIGTPNK